MTPPPLRFVRAEFILLQQEGYLFRSSLTQGLTALRSANLQNPLRTGKPLLKR